VLYRNIEASTNNKVEGAVARIRYRGAVQGTSLKTGFGKYWSGPRRIALRQKVQNVRSGVLKTGPTL
jgi:hypothetical protein